MGGQEESEAGCIPSLLPPCLVAILVWLDPVETQGGVASCSGWCPLSAMAGIVPLFMVHGSPRVRWSLAGKPAWKIPSEGASLELGF